MIDNKNISFKTISRVYSSIRSFCGVKKIISFHNKIDSRNCYRGAKFGGIKYLISDIKNKLTGEIWIIGCYSGNRFCDNSKYFFLFMQNNKPEIKTIWLTHSKEIKNQIIDDGGEAYLIFSLRGFMFALFSKVIIRSYSIDDVGFFAYLFSSKKKIINLSHGIPFKRGDTFRRTFANKLFKSIFCIFVGREVDLVISESLISNESLALLYDKKSIALTGAPRTDVFFNLPKSRNKELTVFYAPTWRDYPYDLLKLEDLANINRFLESVNMILYIKWHSSDGASRIRDFSKYGKIRLAQDDVTEHLISADVLITDYSSIFLDYLLLDRPIIFAAFDLNLYEKNRGFHYNYNEVTPGVKARNWEEVLDNLKNIVEGIDNWSSQRKSIRDKFHSFQDGKSSERLFKAINSIENK